MWLSPIPSFSLGRRWVCSKPNTKRFSHFNCLGWRCLVSRFFLVKQQKARTIDRRIEVIQRWKLVSLHDICLEWQRGKRHGESSSFIKRLRTWFFLDERKRQCPSHSFFRGGYQRKKTLTRECLFVWWRYGRQNWRERRQSEWTFTWVTLASIWNCLPSLVADSRVNYLERNQVSYLEKQL